MFNRKNVESGSRNLLEILFLMIISVIILHIFWQLINNAQSGGNQIIADISARFGLDQELSIPTWLSSIMAFMVAVFAWIIGKAQKGVESKFGWYLIGLVGLFISVDEVAALHELLLQGLHILAQFGEGQSFLNNAWLLVLPFITVAALFGFRYLRKALPGDTFAALVIAGVVYVSGALVVEFLSIPFDKAALNYLVGTVVAEEGLELFGVWLILRALLQHINTHEAGLRKTLSKLVS